MAPSVDAPLASTFMDTLDGLSTVAGKALLSLFRTCRSIDFQSYGASQLALLLVEAVERHPRRARVPPPHAGDRRSGCPDAPWFAAITGVPGQSPAPATGAVGGRHPASPSRSRPGRIALARPTLPCETRAALEHSRLPIPPKVVIKRSPLEACIARAAVSELTSGLYNEMRKLVSR